MSIAHRLPPLKALRVFEAAVRTGSLSAAAMELSLTQSAISQQIKLLESHFGRTMLVRGHRGVVPTAPALTFYDEVRASLDMIALAAERLEQLGETRALNVNVTPSIAVQWLIPRLSSFQVANPRVEVRIATSVARATEVKDPFDVCVRRAPMVKAGYACERFLDDILVPVASPAYAKKFRIRSVDDLKQCTLLHLTSRPNAWSRWLSANGARSMRAKDGPGFEHFFLSVQAASANLGVALGSLALIDDELASGRLIRLFPETVVREAGFHMLHRVPERGDNALEFFVAWLKARGAESAAA